MRGKVLFLDVGDSVTGITPAYAGKSVLGSGELQALGITPAYAGKSFAHLVQIVP